MLKQLYIKNMAVIGELRLDFDSGFHVFTGETGAGKSILVEAIGLILGQKSKTSLIRQGENLALVEAVFTMPKSSPVHEYLANLHLQNPESDVELIVKRQIQSDGQSRIFINHQRATLRQLQELARELIDFTGQHEALQLLQRNNDRNILDAFLPKNAVQKNYSESYQKASALHASILEKEQKLLEKDERLQWIEFQLRELSDLPASSDEEWTNLLTLRDRMKHHDVIENFSRKTDDLVGQTLGSLQELQSLLRKHPVLSETFSFADPLFLEIRPKLEDISFLVQKAAAKALPQSDALNLNDIESHLYKIEKLKRKFGPDFSDLLRKKSELEEEKSSLEALEVDLNNLQKKLAKEIVVLADWAKQLYDLRCKVAKTLQQKVETSLKSLQMDKARFEVRVTLAESLGDFSSYRSSGADEISFWLSANPGLGFKPLAEVASGGETARLFLAIKNVLGESRHFGTFIFDEIDTGISGAAVELTGKKLKTLSKNSQVFCVTHHAQIASLADRHFFVSKDVAKGTTLTRVKILSADDRVHEVARLMGGVKVTEKNLEFARELLLNTSRDSA